MIGTKRSGKTVSLTALISHLRNHDQQLLDLKGWFITSLESDGGNTGNIDLFKYVKACDKLSRGEWPGNTISLSVYRF